MLSGEAYYQIEIVRILLPRVKRPRHKEGMCGKEMDIEEIEQAVAVGRIECPRRRQGGSEGRQGQLLIAERSWHGGC